MYNAQMHVHCTRMLELHCHTGTNHISSPLISAQVSTALVSSDAE